MSQLVDDVKTTLKGVRGAGDAVRGDLMDAADKAFEKDPNHPESIAKNTKNQAIREKGKEDVRNVDEMFARHEWDRKRGVEGKVREPPAQTSTKIPVERQHDHLRPRNQAAPTEPAMVHAQATESRKPDFI